MLTKIKNAQAAHHESVKVPFSNFNEAVLATLEKHKFIDSFAKKGRLPKRIIDVKLRYKNELGAIQGVKVLSRPSRALYAGYKDIRPVRQGYGICVMSTPKGVLSDKEARKEKVGGQLLFEIW